MDFHEAFGNKRADILRIARSHGATRVRLFGSFAQGTANERSDIDFLIDLEPGRDLFDLIAIELDLEELLGRDVDVVTEGGINRRLRNGILDDSVPL
jgi:predicted nucleotidyltransferase